MRARNLVQLAALLLLVQLVASGDSDTDYDTGDDWETDDDGRDPWDSVPILA
jgi:hypothetical protein